MQDWAVDLLNWLDGNREWVAPAAALLIWIGLCRVVAAWFCAGASKGKIVEHRIEYRPYMDTRTVNEYESCTGIWFWNLFIGIPILLYLIDGYFFDGNVTDSIGQWLEGRSPA